MSNFEFTSLNEFFDPNSLPILIEDNDQIDSILEFDECSFQQSMNDAINIEENLYMSEINDKLTSLNKI